MNIAAFDIGGTSLKMGVVDDRGNILTQESADISHNARDKILEEIVGWLEKNPGCEGIAVSTPGYIDPDKGFIEMGGTIRDFDQFHLSQWLTEKTSLPATVENDAHCALLAEYWLGKAKKLNDFLMLTIGTGLGGAAFCNGALIRGGRNRAGEFGCLLTSRPTSSDIERHTMSQSCTMTALRENYSQLTDRPVDDVSGKDVFDACDRQEKMAQQVVEKFYQDLAACLYNLFSVFDPQMIFIGGGITAREPFLEELAEQLEKYQIDIRIDAATYGNDSGMLGATWNFLQRQPQKN
ncbi:ROK family protein (plasmid) [Pantoea anthophila]|uniref:ROK family protein n=1 Tax=Pantoea TaxID=53335 RepID=UPI0012B9A5CA|nr:MULTISPECIES: ROK family protein [Pantoea]MEB5707895.1 ROK family protein [Pantoea anthophila]MEB6518766.1 ROK family protein [Pantoea anthophila]UZH04989.1 ROK family protein [Pantoea anthophila]